MGNLDDEPAAQGFLQAAFDGALIEACLFGKCLFVNNTPVVTSIPEALLTQAHDQPGQGGAKEGQPFIDVISRDHELTVRSGSGIIKGIIDPLYFHQLIVTQHGTSTGPESVAEKNLKNRSAILNLGQSVESLAIRPKFWYVEQLILQEIF